MMSLWNHLYLLLLKKKAEKQFVKDNPDVKECTSLITKLPTELSKSFSVLSEAEELVAKFIYEAVIVTLNKNENEVQEIYFTDLYFDKTYKKMLRFTFTFTEKNYQ